MVGTSLWLRIVGYRMLRMGRCVGRMGGWGGRRVGALKSTERGKGVEEKEEGVAWGKLQLAIGYFLPPIWMESTFTGGDRIPDDGMTPGQAAAVVGIALAPFAIYYGVLGWQGVLAENNDDHTQATPQEGRSTESENE